MRERTDSFELDNLDERANAPAKCSELQRGDIGKPCSNLHQVCQDAGHW